LDRVLDHDHADLHLLSNWNYRHKPPHPAQGLLSNVAENCRGLQSYRGLLPADVTQKTIVVTRKAGELLHQLLLSLGRDFFLTLVSKPTRVPTRRTVGYDAHNQCIEQKQHFDNHSILTVL
jgi:hypothetical protein